tara:strand:+ start:766 stop:1215 length:450 start_codon:yes stop_codon:yes gene_type:complete
MDWTNFFNDLSDEEKDKIAILRVMECTNGVIQHAHRDGASYALPIEETREAMQFSMGAIKRMTIPLRDKDITFEPETEAVLRKIRDLYISGVKNGHEENYQEFMRASEASVQGVGWDRLVEAAKTIHQNFDNPIGVYSSYGLQYLSQFV